MKIPNKTPSRCRQLIARQRRQVISCPDASLEIPGKGPHNVVYIAALRNWVYAYDADGRDAAPPWSIFLGAPMRYDRITKDGGAILGQYTAATAGCLSSSSSLKKVLRRAWPCATGLARHSMHGVGQGHALPSEHVHPVFQQAPSTTMLQSSSKRSWRSLSGCRVGTCRRLVDLLKTGSR